MFPLSFSNGKVRKIVAPILSEREGKKETVDPILFKRQGAVIREDSGVLPSAFKAGKHVANVAEAMCSSVLRKPFS